VAVASVVPVAGGGAIPPEGMSPANAEDERTTASVIDINSRFTGSSPLKFKDARFLTSERIEQLPEVLARCRVRQLISPRLSKFSYTHWERAISHEDNLTEDPRITH
jgi:hypothetical protein